MKKLGLTNNLTLDIMYSNKRRGTAIAGKVKSMITRTWKVYGIPGHRQRTSFGESVKCDWSVGDDVRIVELINSDKTGTNDYTIIRITRNTPEECQKELDGQISDGFFENSRVGIVEEIK